MFAILMSVCNLAGILSHEFGALLTHWMGITDTHFEQLWLLVTVTNLATLLPLPLLHWLPETAPLPEEETVFAIADSLAPELTVAEIVPD
jgi:hypothetical protein